MSVYAGNNSLYHRETCGRDGAPCPTGEHGYCPGCRSSREVLVTAPVEQHDDGCPATIAWPSNPTKENKHVDDGTVLARTEAAAGVYAVICSLVATDRHDAVKHLVNGLSTELLRDVNRVMKADLPQRVADAVKAGLLQPDELLVDETVTPTRIVVRELAEPQEKPRRREPMWDQYVETALVEVLGDRSIVSGITANRESYRNLVRRVRERAEEDDIEAVDVLRRLGKVKLSAVTQVDDPVIYLTAKVRDWTPDTDPDVW